MSKELPKELADLLGMLKQRRLLSAPAGLIYYGLQTGDFPPGSVDGWGESRAAIAKMVHEFGISADTRRIVEAANKPYVLEQLNDNQKAIATSALMTLGFEIKLPSKFVERQANAQTKADTAWRKAHNAAEKDGDSAYKDFVTNHLPGMIEIAREEAGYYGDGNPWEELHRRYEPGMDLETATNIFDSLEADLVPFHRGLIEKSEAIPNPLNGMKFPIDDQMRVCRVIAEILGFDFTRGKFGVVTHPFATGILPTDVRITTRFKETNIKSSLFGIMHEAGHGLYEQGRSDEAAWLEAEVYSLGIHESQSRTFENFIGRSLSFIRYIWPVLTGAFPQLRKVDVVDFWRYINKVENGFIRVEADEVSYNLHILLRFQMETAILNGDIEIADIPNEWNTRFEKFFGVVPPTLSKGCWQDVHWSWGLFGYFPNYTYGNMIAGQFWRKRIMPAFEDVNTLLRQGDVASILNILRTDVHSHGIFWSASGLVEKVTGEKLTHTYLMDYLRDKYMEVYSV